MSATDRKEWEETKATLVAEVLAAAQRLIEHTAAASFTIPVEGTEIVLAYGADLGTPASRWKAEGKPDPYGSQYDVERARLSKGSISDDELANGLYLCDRNSLELIGYQTAAKERIRWLSRQLDAATLERDRLADGINRALQRAALANTDVVGIDNLILRCGELAGVISRLRSGLELRDMTHQRDALATAIRDAAVKAGIARADADLTGPHLIMLCNDMVECIEASPAVHVATVVKGNLNNRLEWTSDEAMSTPVGTQLFAHAGPAA